MPPESDGVVELVFENEEAEEDVCNFLALMSEPGNACDILANPLYAAASRVRAEAVRRYRWQRIHGAPPQV